MAFNAENTLIFMKWLSERNMQIESSIVFWENTWELFMESDVAKANTQHFVETMITKAVENPVRKNAKAKKIDPVTVTGEEPVVVEKKVRAPKKAAEIDPVTVTGEEPVVVVEKKARAPKKKVVAEIDPETVTGEEPVVVVEKKTKAPKKAKAAPKEVKAQEEVSQTVSTEEPVITTTEEQPVIEKATKKKAPKKAAVDPVTGEPVVVEKKPRAKKTKEVVTPVVAQEEGAVTPIVVVEEAQDQVVTPELTEEPIVVEEPPVVNEKTVAEKKPRTKKTKAPTPMVINNSEKEPSMGNAEKEADTGLEEIFQNLSVSEPVPVPVPKTKKPRAKKVVAEKEADTGLEDIFQNLSVSEPVPVPVPKTKKPRAKKQEAVEVAAPVLSEEPVEIIGSPATNDSEESFDEIQLQELTFGDKQLYMDVENNVYDETFTIVGRYIDENTIEFN